MPLLSKQRRTSVEYPYAVALSFFAGAFGAATVGRITAQYPHLMARIRLARVANHLGLPLVMRRPLSARATGEIGGLPVSVETGCSIPRSKTKGRDRSPHTRITVDVRHLSLGGLEILLGVTETNVLVGSEDRAIALLHAPLEDVTGEGDCVQVKDGFVQLDCFDRARTTEQLEMLVHRLVEVSRDLEKHHREVEQCLLNHTLHAKRAIVRKNNLRALVSHYPQSETANIAVSHAVEDADPGVRMVAAIHLGVAGCDSANEIALDPTIDDHLRLRAVQHLLDHAGPDTLKEILEELLEERAIIVGERVVLEYGRLLADEAIPSLVELIEKDVTPVEVAVAATESIERIDTEASQKALARLLEHEHHQVKMAAIDGLGRTAPRSEVFRLRPFTKGLFVRNDLKVAAAAAIVLIQDRGELSTGGLSLVDSSEPIGALSAPDPIGGLSPLE